MHHHSCRLHHDYYPTFSSATNTVQINTSPTRARSSLPASQKISLDLGLSLKVVVLYHLTLIDTIIITPSLWELMKDTVFFTVFPIPAYSFPDPVSGLSSTSWLLDQADNFQQLHIILYICPVWAETHPDKRNAHSSILDASGIWRPSLMGGWKYSRSLVGCKLCCR